MNGDDLLGGEGAPVASGPFGLMPLEADPLLEAYSPLQVSRGEAMGARRFAKVRPRRRRPCWGGRSIE
jgi:hypothetical protein